VKGGEREKKGIRLSALSTQESEGGSRGRHKKVKSVEIDGLKACSG